MACDSGWVLCEFARVCVWVNTSVLGVKRDLIVLRKLYWHRSFVIWRNGGRSGDLPPFFLDRPSHGSTNFTNVGNAQY
jgi:hypothetical protein